MNINPNNELCVGCGEVAEGSAHVGKDRYCHGDYTIGESTCYMRATNRFWSMDPQYWDVEEDTP